MRPRIPVRNEAGFYPYLRKYLPFGSENDIVKYDQDKNSQKSPKAVWFQYFMLEGREAKC